MKYANARELLPEAMVKELQTYIQGGYLYVPAGEKRRPWGELSGYRKELRERNDRIIEAYRKGASAQSLARRYCLSVPAIRKIVYAKR